MEIKTIFDILKEYLISKRMPLEDFSIFAWVLYEQEVPKLSVPTVLRI